MDSIFQGITASLLDAVVATSLQSSHRPPYELKSRILQKATCIGRENGGRIIDPPSERWVTFCSLLLAAYRTLMVLTGDRLRVISVIEEAIARPLMLHMDVYLEDRFGIPPDAPKEAFDRIAANFRTRGEERFGATFTYVQEAQDQDRTHITITKCFFNDFLVENGAPELIPVLCALDMVWAGEIEHPRYGVHFERPTTLAAGEDACRFQFSRLKHLSDAAQSQVACTTA
jgi:hypothetical protein